MRTYFTFLVFVLMIVTGSLSSADEQAAAKAAVAEQPSLNELIGKINFMMQNKIPFVIAFSDSRNLTPRHQARLEERLAAVTEFERSRSGKPPHIIRVDLSLRLEESKPGDPNASAERKLYIPFSKVEEREEFRVHLSTGGVLLCRWAPSGTAPLQPICEGIYKATVVDMYVASLIATDRKISSRTQGQGVLNNGSSFWTDKVAGDGPKAKAAKESRPRPHLELKQQSKTSTDQPK